ncbi:ribose-5-phosphate isomerase RpiA [Cytobacillus gottheilii]|uniref:Ribose-5-phosphate isomerase A n=1 Tax=Cytobacillus gottheilii TaxID=859144 RepID=A0ABX8FFH6_9BACI|nr:ribose-5-phosphate isomerase RpiA [Cytobacillus gottheilii]QVY62761.1 ribose-5-phosphate isomerase RpiA [Cytobacillus gottheilii]
MDDKRIAAEEAVKYVKNGMTVGLGSGSTVDFMLHALGKRVQEGLQIQGIPSSKKTEKLAKELGIPLVDFSVTTHIDLAIDGADEIDPSLNLIKGGGGSLVREKVVDACADELIIIADSSKVVSTLGRFPLPVEVLTFGFEVTAEYIKKLGGDPVLRRKDGEVFISDNRNYILDCSFGHIDDAARLHETLVKLVGVVDTGIFADMADKVIVANKGEIELFQKKQE